MQQRSGSGSGSNHIRRSHISHSSHNKCNRWQRHGHKSKGGRRIYRRASAASTASITADAAGTATRADLHARLAADAAVLH